MPNYSRGSKKTQYTCLIVAVLAYFFSPSATCAGTIGTSEAETNRLQQELDTARNAFDAAVLRPGVKLSDPSVKEKATTLEEKTGALRRNFQDAQTLPKTTPTSPPPLPESERDDEGRKGEAPLATVQAPQSGNYAPPSLPRIEAPREPESILSGAGVQKEIQYSKKSKSPKTEKPIPRRSPKVDSAEEPVPEETSKPDAAGLSEIQYSKKKPSPTPAK